MDARTKAAFRRTIYGYYKKHGRDLPWRKTTHPYKILVSEVMLQQTQVDRVISTYRAFLKSFPTMRVLARASQGEVLRAWQGLGYNRRAKMLHACARTVCSEYAGRLPRTHAELTALPGIGPYTAGAVMAFAYNQAVPIIETNIRTVYLHYFFKDKKSVSDMELLPYIEATLDTKRPREWYWALMDYGAHLKQTIGNASVQSKHYKKQSTFAGSDRQIRGAIIRLLTEKTSCTEGAIAAKLPYPKARIRTQLTRLCDEGMIERAHGKWRL